MFGPQKGASPADVRVLDDALSHYARMLGGDAEARGSGAAGGTSFGFVTVWGARMESGADHVQRVTGLWEAIDTVDLVITGEGQFDGQSLSGKVVGQVLRRAEDVGTKAAVIAGQLAVSPPVWAASLVELAGSVTEALAHPDEWLRAAGELAAAELGEGAAGA